VDWRDVASGRLAHFQRPALRMALAAQSGGMRALSLKDVRWPALAGIDFQTEDRE